MSKLHIVQGGPDNGDIEALRNAAAKDASTISTWIVPKRVNPGDGVIVYVAGIGLFATAIIASKAKPRPDWPNRYGAKLSNVKLINPAISLKFIQTAVPELTWTNYPRSITTPSDTIANELKKLVKLRRNKGIREFIDNELKHFETANLDELYAAAILKSRPTASIRERKAVYRIRSVAIKKYVLKRAGGNCEGCNTQAPFLNSSGDPYLEPHHTLRLSDDGPDHPQHVIALCPNCHRRAHHAKNAANFNKSLIRKLKTIQPSRKRA